MGIDLGRRIPAVKIPLPWAKIALLLPARVAEDILAWAENEDDSPQRVTLTKVRIGGAAHIQADVMCTYRRRRA